MVLVRLFVAFGVIVGFIYITIHFSHWQSDHPGESPFGHLYEIATYPSDATATDTAKQTAAKASADKKTTQVAAKSTPDHIVSTVKVANNEPAQLPPSTPKIPVIVGATSSETDTLPVSSTEREKTVIEVTPKIETAKNQHEATPVKKQFTNTQAAADNNYTQLTLDQFDPKTASHARAQKRKIHYSSANREQRKKLKSNSLKNIFAKSKTTEIKPRNEIGYGQNESYLSDLNTYWSYGYLHYYRLTDHGKFGASINLAKRDGNFGMQYMLEAYPVFKNNSHLAIAVGYANESQKVWATRHYYLEYFFNLGKNYEASIGGRMARSISKYIYMKTASFGKHFGNNFVWIRPSHFTPKSSLYTELGAMRTFSNPKNYIAFKYGFGKMPDIADFVPLNQIIILRVHSYTLEYQLPVTKNLTLKFIGAYTSQRFPSDLVRRIRSGYLSFNWTF